MDTLLFPIKKRFDCDACQDDGVTRKGDPCPSCCEHNSSGFDHDICIDCGFERDPGAEIDAAMDYLADR